MIVKIEFILEVRTLCINFSTAFKITEMNFSSFSDGILGTSAGGTWRIRTLSIITFTAAKIK
jgi:hypothetical protein